MKNYECDIVNSRPHKVDKELTFNPDEIFELDSGKTSYYDDAVTIGSTITSNDGCCLF